ncbi:MAG: T9SS type A sorting domain-containing protein [bacterium]|nr:T9SS type A sorting domain-containing protein [bacterium]
MRKVLLGILLVQIVFCSTAQTLTEITNLRFYEHHSSTINGGQPFGNGANGSQSGYDFVNHTFYNSFNTVNFGAYTNGEEANIDMVEHNGPFGNGSTFGFTSGTSSIWGGAIQGNNTSLWVVASGSFNYASSTNVADLESEYNAGTPSNTINAVQENGIYISKIRNTNLYIAIKCYNVTNISGPPSGVQDVYFDFDYKYGTLSSVGITELSVNSISIYPNPSKNIITINNESQINISKIKLVDLLGKEVKEIIVSNTDKQVIDVSELNTGVYSIVIFDKNNNIVNKRLIVN